MTSSSPSCFCVSVGSFSLSCVRPNRDVCAHLFHRDRASVLLLQGFAAYLAAGLAICVCKCDT